MIWFFNSFALHGKDNALQATKKKVSKLTERIHELEVENARLQGEQKETVVKKRFSEEQLSHPSVFGRLRQSVR